MKLRYHHISHLVRQFHSIHHLLHRVRLRLPHRLPWWLFWPQRMHMHAWIGLSRGWDSWGMRWRDGMGWFWWTTSGQSPDQVQDARDRAIHGDWMPHIHLRFYSSVMRAHGLDEAQMIMLFPMSLSGTTQYWFASLDVSRHRTWDDLAQEFLRQFAFNTCHRCLTKGVGSLEIEARWDNHIIHFPLEGEDCLDHW